MGKIIYKNLSYSIVGLLYEVYNDLGIGYKEKYYELALEKLLNKNNIKHKRQIGYKIRYKEEIIGICYLDFLIEDKVVLELKKGDYFSPHNMEQIINYLKVTKLKLGILANFTSKGVKFKRILNI